MSESPETEFAARRNRPEPKINKFFKALVQLKGSDLHLKTDRPPYIRIAGTLKPVTHPPIGDEEMESMLFEIMNERNRKIFH